MTASEFSDVFVSYRRSDVEFVKQLVESLRAEGKEVWVDWEDIPPGVEGFADEIKRGLEGADAFIAVLSVDYLLSDYCVKMELAYAVKLNKRIIPIVLSKFDGMNVPRGIGHINWIYFTPHAGQKNRYEDSFPKVIEVLHADLDHVRQHKRFLLRSIAWDENNRASSYLLNGDEITQGEAWLIGAVGKDPAPTDLHKLYITTSRKLAVRRHRVMFTGVVVALVISIAFAILSLIGFGNASLAEATAVANYAVAVTAQHQAQISENFALTKQVDAENSAAIALTAQRESEQNQYFALTQKAQAEANLDLASTAQFESEQNQYIALTQGAVAQANEAIAITSQFQAEENYLVAEAAKAEAERNLIEAWQIQGRFFGDLAMQNARLYDMASQLAMRLGIQALLHTDSQAYSAQAYEVLDSAIRQPVQPLFYIPVDTQAKLIDISINKQFVVFASSTVQIVDTTTGDVVLEMASDNMVQYVVNPANDYLSIVSTNTNTDGIDTYWLQVLDINEPAIVWKQEIANAIEIQWSGNYQNIIALDREGATITLYDGATGDTINRYGSGRRLMGLRLNPLQAISQNGNVIEFTDVDTGETKYSCELDTESTTFNISTSLNQAYLLITDKTNNAAWLCDINHNWINFTWDTGTVSWLQNRNVLLIVKDDRIEVRDMSNKTWIEVRNPEPATEQYYINTKSQVARIFPDTRTGGTTLKIYNMKTGEETNSVPLDNSIISAKWRADGALLMLWDSQGALLVYDPFQHERVIELNREYGITSAGWTDDFSGIYIISTITQADRTDSIYAQFDSTTGEKRFEIVHNAPLNAVFVLNDHQIMTSTVIEDAARFHSELWKWDTSFTSSLLSENPVSNSSLWLPENEQLLYIGLIGDTNPLPLRLVMWDQMRGEAIYQRDFVESIRLGGLIDGGQSVILFSGLPYYTRDVASEDIMFIVLNTANGDERQIIHTHMMLTNALISSDGQYVAGWLNTDNQSQVRIWDIETGEVVYGTTWDGAVSNVRWSPDSELLALQTTSGIRIVNIQQGKIISTLPFEGASQLHGWDESSDTLLVSNTKDATATATTNLFLWTDADPDNPRQIKLDFALGLIQWGNSLVVTSQSSTGLSTEIVIFSDNTISRQITVEGAVKAIAMNPQGTTLAYISQIVEDTGLSYYTANTWRLEDDTALSLGHIGSDTSPFVIWNDEGSKFITKAGDVIIWDEQSHLPFLELPSISSIRDVIWSKSGQHITTLNQIRTGRYQIQTWVTDYNLFINHAQNLTLREFTNSERARLFLSTEEEAIQTDTVADS